VDKISEILKDDVRSVIFFLQICWADLPAINGAAPPNLVI
jgi:hypothetical protein